MLSVLRSTNIKNMSYISKDFHIKSKTEKVFGALKEINFSDLRWSLLENTMNLLETKHKNRRTEFNVMFIGHFPSCRH